MKPLPRATTAVLALLAAACGQTSTAAAPSRPAIPFTLSAEACTAEDAAATYPGANWTEVDPTAAGWSDDGLQRWLDAAQRAHWAAGMIVHRGQVVARFGDLERTYDTRSIRKSIMGAIVGQLIAEDRLSLTATLDELGIDENQPLTATERTATLQQLLQSRSGVYRPAAFMTPADREGMPAPGSHAPGTHYWYNNWDFNAVGTIVRNVAGDLGQNVEARIARPLGMQEFAASDVRERFEEVSRHSAYRIWMSTRDRARFGYMMLRNGCWQGRQLVPAAWVAESLYPHTNRDGADDFGYMWRSQEPLEAIGMNERFYSSRGNNLQYIMLIPEWDIVMVLTTDMDRPGWWNWVHKRMGLMPEPEHVSQVLRALAAARPRD